VTNSPMISNTDAIIDKTVIYRNKQKMKTASRKPVHH